MSPIRPVVGLPTLAWLRAFEAAARTSSFTAAAAELNLTSGAISYQIRALEGASGLRTVRAPAPRRQAHRRWAWPICRPCARRSRNSPIRRWGFSAVRNACRSPFTRPCRWPRCGLLRSCPRSAGANPAIDVRLASVIWDNAVLDDATDLEIRYGAGQWHGYRSERLLNQNVPRRMQSGSYSVPRRWAVIQPTCCRRN